MIVHRAQHGPMRVVLEAHGGALALFAPAHRSRVIKRALREGGSMWLHKWMPLRFTKYAYVIGYRVSGKWRNIKERYLAPILPFVGFTPTGGGKYGPPGWSGTNGAKMADAVRGARITAGGRDGAERIDIRIPYGHPVQSRTSAVFKTVTARELDDVAAVFSRRLASEISGARLGRVNGRPRLIPRSIKRATPRRVT